MDELETQPDVKMALRGYHEGLRDGNSTATANTWLLCRIVDLEIIARKTRRGSELAAYLTALDDMRAVIRNGPNV